MNEIDKGVPIPAVSYGKRRCSKFPLDRMEIGDSYFVECASRQDRVSAAGAAHKWGAAHQRIFTTRQVEGGIRVWRTA